MTVSDRKITRSGLFVIGLAAVALTGWGAFAYSGESRAVLERELRAHIHQAEAERARLLEDRIQLQQELNHVYFEKRSFSSSGSSWSLTQRRSAMTKGSRFRRASKSATRRVRSSALAWQW